MSNGHIAAHRRPRGGPSEPVGVVAAAVRVEGRRGRSHAPSPRRRRSVGGRRGGGRRSRLVVVVVQVVELVRVVVVVGVVRVRHGVVHPHRRVLRRRRRRHSARALTHVPANIKTQNI